MTDFSNATLNWDEHGQPHSSQFDDVYFSRASGLEETRYVFLQHNQLAERFAALKEHALFRIGETGFGTGLNFLCAWQCFVAQAPANARLHFFSVEKYPLSLDDLQRALSLWPELAELSAALIQQYRGLQRGFQTLHFAGGRVTLTLLLGDVLELLPTLNGSVDAWFLDGFAPAKNPQMWQPELFAALARTSHAGTTLATFTCAGFVRRGLEAEGFALQKVSGFGHKREMLAGHYTKNQARSAAMPWYAQPATPPQGHALVVGAGLSGCATANALARRGWKVTVLERHSDYAQEASGNRQGITYLKLSPYMTQQTQLVLSGFGYTRRLLEQLPRGNDGAWDNCGVLILESGGDNTERQQALANAFPNLLQMVSKQQASELAGVDIPSGGLWLANGGWVNPRALCKYLLNHPNIRVELNADVTSVLHADQQWQVCTGDGRQFSSPVLVLANAAEAGRLSVTAHMPHKAIRGQVTHVPATPASSALRTVLCGSGYIAPAWQGMHNIGASFVFAFEDLQPTAAEHASNLEILNELSPALHDQLKPDPVAELEARVGIRCSAPDYLPLVGPVAEPEAFCQRYAKLREDAFARLEQPCPWQAGLYINTGHGSRGLITAPLSGELLAAHICAETMPVPTALMHACHPNRFLQRDLVKRRR
ncbi:tRNA 5-methylaminomethyl-2-thiouridine biosynthesis bifunctional protein [Atopomonas hussainii]|uniref:tRNA 5-methylaminomethyl-2-thiouridine biosynthesis bifunctional protein MnmC n=1 Tax=Atopomonas hussainii TaxID=1429083 RepID=A0A1H7SC15_9GAMM|nr:bifunctional tRNA (5-methylaminomethyl-2-thiouridine)(34)-methyltransferase MnmD/FAD-dependent 5-carboxymethylaminomethyl-2-thiouridine(34) oxidoreductase MnmC [Atopomonas hussainii]SEL70201.1 tRNA 5-methylaminomethyl-2-thiouridine biosynthesis bifunctional protein [Atopomonas hussainii]